MAHLASVVAALAEFVTTLHLYGVQSLVEGNRKVYDWRRNGVPRDKKPA